MKKRYCIFLLVVFWVMILSACGSKVDNGDTARQPVTDSQEETKQGTEPPDKGIENAPKEPPENSLEEDTAAMQEMADNKEEGDTPMQGMVVKIGGQKFQITLYDNETVHALKEQLPMTLNMEELHGNEKFYYLDEGLPTNAENVGSIQTGDLMLFGSDCLVLFFEDFNTSYSYTRIGHIEDAKSFANALENGTVEVTFETGE